MLEKQLHGARIVKSLRSRSAAKARRAWISSTVGQVKSERISATDIPAARYPNIREIVSRMPRMHGLPFRLQGPIVIRKLSAVNNKLINEISDFGDSKKLSAAMVRHHGMRC